MTVSPPESCPTQDPAGLVLRADVPAARADYIKNQMKVTAAGAAVADDLGFILRDGGTNLDADNLVDIDLRQRPTKVQKLHSNLRRLLFYPMTSHRRRISRI